MTSKNYKKTSNSDVNEKIDPRQTPVSWDLFISFKKAYMGEETEAPKF